MSDTCIFCKIAKGDIPARKVHEDEEFLAFHDISPAAPVHLLLIPRHHIVSMAEVTQKDAGWLGRMMILASRLAEENGCRPGPEGGFRLVANAGADGGQEVPHLHFHILGGARPWQGRMASIA
ncbi:FIG146285: Diadenosine tetraphosphate (Ap4A) hydrolase and other HIT family hydrolases [plant metagenome]|uniref:FIG146285: Diadenosine tetraphosphate (Ap4A) hydrolase and other HIT family hydrolases n=2 Tax=root TaxID=1 RepID=A0A1C3K1S9_9BURK|nr:histidine triad nucleotide-binding protein [Orrella dioscoreae]SBT25469.1 FIG146285: Diadenosine tetraphosphate (Ap4A) hydrolase and other HIT family hydrolases [Orrella dioscoreae]SOE46365.1 FIG146285: Diadenosine tetraphosphate (Ap4A) hydrolase and other HIT family hydrolases [Orrella dioscoreae]